MVDAKKVRRYGHSGKGVEVEGKSKKKVYRGTREFVKGENRIGVRGNIIDILGK